MIHRLHLTNFKNFRDATLDLGRFTVLIGANASGKSNIRDAFRFLHGVGRGYGLAEILGEKYEGGDRIWSGVRGGAREIKRMGAGSFALKVDLEVGVPQLSPDTFEVNYSTEIFFGNTIDKHPYVNEESITIREEGLRLFDTKTSDKNATKLTFWREPGVKGRHPPSKTYFPGRSIVSQVAEDEDPKIETSRDFSREIARKFRSFRFLDLSPTQMRLPSYPGQTNLGDRGENLSSVLLAICEDAPKKEALIEWVRRLTPMDVDDLEFDRDAAGKVLIRLKERGGRSISALSASDGTLRFLAIVAALFNPSPASFYFIEELENGIHPTRLGLLADLIQNQTRQHPIQVVATCHAPLLLQYLDEDALRAASLVYRLPGHPDARIRKILKIPEAARVIKEQGVSILHASSWFEDVLNLTDDDETGG